MKYINHEASQEKFYASYGKLIHELLAEYYRGELPKDELPMQFLTRYFSDVKGKRPKPQTVYKYIEQAVSYLSSFEPLPYKAIAVEKKVEFDVSGKAFVGFIDFIGEDENGGLCIVDHKSADLKPYSNKKKRTQNDDQLDAIFRQLYIYSAAVFKEYGRLPVKIAINAFRNNRLIEIPFNIKKYDEAIEWAKSEIKVIEDEEDFIAEMEWFKCGWICDVSDKCPYWQDENWRRSR